MRLREADKLTAEAPCCAGGEATPPSLFGNTGPFLHVSASVSHSYTYLLGTFGNNNFAVIVVRRLLGDGGSLSPLLACPRAPWTS